MLEFCDGGSLSQSLHNRKVAWSSERQRSVALMCAAGLAHLHHSNVVHRDIAARNVLLTSSGVAKLTDFGMSKVRCGRNVSERVDSRKRRRRSAWQRRGSAP